MRKPQGCRRSFLCMILDARAIVSIQSLAARPSRTFLLLPLYSSQMTAFRPGRQFAMKILQGIAHVQRNLSSFPRPFLLGGFMAALLVALSVFYLRKKSFGRPHPKESAVAGLVQARDRLQRHLVEEDADKLRRLNNELAQKTAFLQALVECNDDGVLFVDNEGRRILRNQQIEQLLGLPKNTDADDARAWAKHFMANALYPEQMEERERHLNQHPHESLQDEIKLVNGKVVGRHSFPVFGGDGTCRGRIRDLQGCYGAGGNREGLEVEYGVSGGCHQLLP